MAVQHLITKCRRYWRRYAIACLSFLSIISIEVILIYLLVDRQVDAEREAVRKLAVIQGELLQRQLDQSFSVPFTLALIVRHQQGTVKNFDALAADLINSYGGIRHLKLAPEGIVREMYPRGENASGIDRHLFTDRSNSSQGLTAIASRTIQVTKPLELFPEGPENIMGIVGYLPVFLNQGTDAEEFWGFTIVEISIADLLQESKFNQLVQQGYDYQLEWFDPGRGDRWVFARSQKADLVEPITHPVKVAYGNWILGISPRNGWGSKRKIIFEIVFILVVGSLVAYLVYKLLEQPEILQQQVELRVADLSKINQQLIAEITERQRIEQALRESEEHFRAIADATPIPLVISRCSDGLVLYGNQSLCQIFGIPPEKLMGCQTPDYYCDRNDRG
jgi:PAS domain-containing protein